MNNILKYGEYLGAVNRSFDLDGLKLTETSYRPYSALPSHYHENNYLCFVTRGIYSEDFDGNSIHCTAGDMIIHPPAYKHSNIFLAGGVTCLNIELSNEWVERYRLALKTINDLYKVQNPEVALLSSRINREISSRDNFSALAIEGLVIQIFAEIERERNKSFTKSPAWLKKVEEILNDTPASQSVTLRMLASETGMHPVYLSRAFKQHKNKTIGEYFRGLKIKKALDLLINTRLPVSHIAHDCGFSDQSHFTRIFRKYTGTSPGAFRKSAGNKS